MKTLKDLSIADLAAKRDNYSTELEAQVALYNKLNCAEERKASEVVKARTKVDELCASYNNASKLIAYKELEATERPIITAVSRLNYGVVGVHEKKAESELEPPVLEIRNGSKAFDLIDIAKRTQIEFHAENWEKLAKEINYRLVYATAVNMGADCKFISDYESMREVRKAIERREYPLALVNLTSGLYASVEAIIGCDYKELWDTVVGEDVNGDPLTVGNSCVNFVERMFCKKGKKALQVSCAKHSAFVGLVAEVCHLLVTGDHIEVESRALADEIKKAKKQAEKLAKKEAEKKAKEAAAQQEAEAQQQ